MAIPLFDTALDAKVAAAAGFATMMLDCGFGRRLYITDPSARRDQTGTIAAVGGDWITGINDDGVPVEAFGYLCPPYSSSIDAAWTLLESLKMRHQYGIEKHNDWMAVVLRLNSAATPWDHSGADMAKHITIAVLEVLTGEDYMG